MTRETTTITAVRVLLGSLMAAVALLTGFAGATAQDAEMDGRWFPWLGCWESLGEDADGSMLCIQPIGGETGVELVTLVDGEVMARDRLSADGTARDRSREGCSGVETARFSDDARRVFVHSDLTCGTVDRASNGLMAMVSPAHWIDVQTVDVGGRSAAWVQHYRLASRERAEAAGFGDIGRGYELAVESGRMMAAAPVRVDDVIEASQQVGGAAVEAWLSELNDGFDLDAQELVRMADAGVPESVIDVVVAVSYPERFAVDNEAERYADRGVRPGYGYGRRGWRTGYYNDPFYSNSFYSPWGYGYGGWGYRPTVVIVEPRPGNDDQGGHGRVVNGRGYTRNRGGGGAPPVARPSNGGSSGARQPAATSGGRTEGSSGSGSSGRTAKPRGGN